MSAVNTPSTPTTGVVISLPGAATKPVVQCRRYGPLPKGVASIPKLKRKRLMAVYMAAQSKQSAIDLDRRIRTLTDGIEELDLVLQKMIVRLATAVAERQKAGQA